MIKELINLVIVVPLVAAVSLVVPSPGDANQLILGVQNQLETLSAQASELATRDLSSSTPETMELSVLEINNKATLAKRELERSQAAYTAGQYFRASWLAGSAKKNADIVGLYLNLLLNDSANSPNNRKIKLQGNITDLVIGAFSPIVIAPPETVPTSTATSTETSTTSEIVVVPPEPVPTPETKQACLDRRNEACRANLSSCLTEASENTEKLQLGCNRALTKDTAACTNVPNKVKCLTAAETKFKYCRDGNIERLTTSLKRCQTNYNICLKQSQNACGKLK